MKIKNILMVFILFVCVLSLASCGKKTISVSSDNIKLAIGETYNIVSKVEKQVLL